MICQFLALKTALYLGLHGSKTRLYLQMMIIMKMMTISTMMMTIAITTTRMTKIINLCSIKCDTSLESQVRRDLESEDDNNNNDDDDK